MKKNIIIAGSILVVLCIGLIYFIYSGKPAAKTAAGAEKQSYSTKISEDEILKTSDTVVKGRIAGMREKSSAIVTVKTSSGKSANVKRPYTVYHLEVSEDIGNTSLKGKSILLLVTSSQIQLDFTGKQEYVFCLKKNPLNEAFKFTNHSTMKYEDTYSISASGGLFKLENNQLKGQDNQVKYDYESFKSKVLKSLQART